MTQRILTGRKQRKWIESVAKVAIVVLVAFCLYVLSSGPVLATAFWLRDKTGWNGFYSAMFVYYPLLVIGHDHNNLIGVYIEWWVNLFDTAGPG